MRRLGHLTVLVSFAAIATSAEARADNGRGFSHIAHDTRAEAAGIRLLKCVDCHRLATTGRVASGLSHNACFGECHGAPPPTRSAAARLQAKPYTIDAKTRVVCETCHGKTDLAKLASGTRSPIRAAVPTAPVNRDFSLFLSHAKHSAAGVDCTACHDSNTPSRPSRSGHNRCAKCHRAPTAKGGVTLSTCDRCHVPAVGPRKHPTRDPGAFSVQQTFSHKSHRRYGEKTCLPCHQGAAASESDWIATPKKKQCDSCHDGKRAFSMTGGTCRSCHQKPVESSARELARQPQIAFPHQVPAHRSAPVECATCHQISGTRRPRLTADHGTCGSEGCHKAAFSSGPSSICAVCHVSAEPWVKAHLDTRSLPQTDFGALFSHRNHLSATTGSPRISATCESCHVPSLSSKHPQLPADHSACGGSTCHDSGASPPLKTCSGCHGLGRAQTRLKQRSARPWTVSAAFSHALHAPANGDPKGSQCSSCHLLEQDAQSKNDLVVPGKRSCLSCHNGVKAFKVTGHGCARCHTDQPAGLLQPDAAAPH